MNRPIGCSLVVRVVWLCLFLTALRAEADSQSQRRSLNLNGCLINDLAFKTVGASPAFVFKLAACNSPVGIFYSFDGEDNWRSAVGGDYTGGPVWKIVFNSSEAFIQTDQYAGLTIFKAELPTSTSWSPVWQKVTLLGNPNNFTVDDHFYIDTGFTDVQRTNYYLGAYNYPAASYVGRLSFTVDPTKTAYPSSLSIDNNYIYYAFGGLLRVLYNGNAPQPFGSAEDLAPLTGAPSNASFARVRGAPNGDVYAGTMDTKIYRGHDSGSGLVFAELPFTYGWDMSFSGAVHMVGGYVSLNSGQDWVELGPPRQSGIGELLSQVVELDPSNPASGYTQVVGGIARCDEITTNPTNCNWRRTNQGFLGVNVYTLDQNRLNHDRVLLHSASGVAVTNNFRSDNPEWLYPLCLWGYDCLMGLTKINPADQDEIFTAKATIYKGRLSSDPSFHVDWVPQDEFHVEAPVLTDPRGSSVFEMSEYLPNTLIVGWRFDGECDSSSYDGLYFYDAQSGALLWRAAGLPEYPLAKVKAINENLIFATVEVCAQTMVDHPETANFPGIYKSIDGGHTFTHVASDVATSCYVERDFAYDVTNDVLYTTGAPINGESCGAPVVFKLEKTVADPNALWKATRSFVMYDYFGHVGSVGIDPVTQILYASAGSYVYASRDGGQTWGVAFSGMQGETLNLIWIDSLDSTSGIGVRGQSRVVVGSSTGLSVIVPEGLPTPEPTAVPPSASPTPVLQCTLSLEKKCKKAVTAGTKCKLTAKVQETAGTAVSGAAVELFKATNAKGPSKLSKRAQTKTNGQSVITVKADKTSWYHIRVSSPASCSSKSVRLSVLKKPKK
jgi:hypothetical protein